MEEVIGLRGTPGHGSLMEWGVTYRELPLAEQGLIDWHALRTAITPSEPVESGQAVQPPRGATQLKPVSLTVIHSLTVMHTDITAHLTHAHSPLPYTAYMFFNTLACDMMLTRILSI